MNEYGFYSVDRLVEFGLSMAIANQMIRVMNESMQDMYVPGSIQSMPAAQPQSVYAAIDGQAVGPLTETEFAALAIRKKITKDSLVWSPGMLQWQPLEQTPSVLKIVAMAPPPLPNH